MGNLNLIRDMATQLVENEFYPKSDKVMSQKDAKKQLEINLKIEEYEKIIASRINLTMKDLEIKPDFVVTSDTRDSIISIMKTQVEQQAITSISQIENPDFFNKAIVAVIIEKRDRQAIRDDQVRNNEAKTTISEATNSKDKAIQVSLGKIMEMTTDPNKFYEMMSSSKVAVPYNNLANRARNGDKDALYNMRAIEWISYELSKVNRTKGTPEGKLLNYYIRVEQLLSLECEEATAVASHVSESMGFDVFDIDENGKKVINADKVRALSDDLHQKVNPNYVRDPSKPVIPEHMAREIRKRTYDEKIYGSWEEYMQSMKDRDHMVDTQKEFVRILSTNNMDELESFFQKNYSELQKFANYLKTSYEERIASGAGSDYKKIALNRMLLIELSINNYSQKKDGVEVEVSREEQDNLNGIIKDTERRLKILKKDPTQMGDFKLELINRIDYLGKSSVSAAQLYAQKLAIDCEFDLIGKKDGMWCIDEQKVDKLRQQVMAELENKTNVNSYNVNMDFMGPMPDTAGSAWFNLKNDIVREQLLNELREKYNKLFSNKDMQGIDAFVAENIDNMEGILDLQRENYEWSLKRGTEPKRIAYLQKRLSLLETKVEEYKQKEAAKAYGAPNTGENSSTQNNYEKVEADNPDNSKAEVDGSTTQPVTGDAQNKTISEERRAEVDNFFMKCDQLHKYGSDADVDKLVNASVQILPDALTVLTEKYNQKMLASDPTCKKYLEKISYFGQVLKKHKDKLLSAINVGIDEIVSNLAEETHIFKSSSQDSSVHPVQDAEQVDEEPEL